MVKDFKVLAFISGRGSNLKSLIENAKYYKISGIISDNPDALGLQYGKDFGIPVHVFSRDTYLNKTEFKNAIFDFATNSLADLFALAGFMQIVPRDFIERMFGKIVNIHPSLLPKFPGLNTHKRAIEAGEKTHGCTVHYVDAGVDTGPIIAQKRLECHSRETEEELSLRVLALEHKLYPWVVNSIAEGSIFFENKCVKYDETLREEAKTLDILI